MSSIKLYRLSRFLYDKNLIFFSKTIKKVNYYLHNSYIPETVKIGKNSRFAYGGIGVVIHKDAQIGENVTIGQGVTIGGKTGNPGAPKIGDNVYISAGSRILGNIKIGNNVVIGANSVVIENIPDNSIVAGVPSKLISKNIDKFKREGII